MEYMKRSVLISGTAKEYLSLLKSLNALDVSIVARRIKELENCDNNSRSFELITDIRIADISGYRIVYRSFKTEAKVMRIEAIPVFVNLF